MHDDDSNVDIMMMVFCFALWVTYKSTIALFLATTIAELWSNIGRGKH